LLADKGYTREEIKELDITWTCDILFPDRDEKSGLPKFVSRRASKKGPDNTALKAFSPEEKIRQLLKLRGCPDHLIDGLVEEAMKEHEKMLKEAGLAK
jgi:hypothetical protein